MIKFYVGESAVLELGLLLVFNLFFQETAFRLNRRFFRSITALTSNSIPERPESGARFYLDSEPEYPLPGTSRVTK